jgi:hypothetical protein
MSRKSSRRYWTKSLELWRAEIEWSCGVSACFQLSSAKRGPAAILVLELPSQSRREPCPPSRLQKKCKSDLIPKLRRWIEQRERSRNFSQNLRSPVLVWSAAIGGCGCGLRVCTHKPVNWWPEMLERVIGGCLCWFPSDRNSIP